MENIKATALKIKYFMEHYEDLKRNLIINKFNNEENSLIFSYEDNIIGFFMTDIGTITQNFKNTQFKLGVKLNKNHSKIRDINFFDKNEKLLVSIKDKNIKKQLISKLEKDLNITNRKMQEQMDIIEESEEESEELFLLEEANNYFTEQTQSKHRTFKK